MANIGFYANLDKLNGSISDQSYNGSDFGGRASISVYGLDEELVKYKYLTCEQKKEICVRYVDCINE